MGLIYRMAGFFVFFEVVLHIEKYYVTGARFFLFCWGVGGLQIYHRFPVLKPNTHLVNPADSLWQIKHIIYAMLQMQPHSLWSGDCVLYGIFLPIEPFRLEWVCANHYSPTTNHNVMVFFDLLGYRRATNISPVPGSKTQYTFGESSGFALGNKTTDVLMGDVTKLTPLALEWVFCVVVWIFLPIVPFRLECFCTNYYSPNYQSPCYDYF